MEAFKRRSVGALERRSLCCRTWDASRSAPRASARLCLYALALLLLAGGCGIGAERKHAAELRAEKLARQKAELTGDTAQYRADIERLRKQVRALSALPKEQRENPYELATIKIARITNFYDKDGDGKREKLIVYVQPIDLEGDTVKAAGTVTVQLWDLNNPNGQARLGEWAVEPAQLKKLWFRSLTTGYRLTFDRPKELDLLAEPLAIKVTFTDYLTGETYDELRELDPKLE